MTRIKMKLKAIAAATIAAPLLVSCGGGSDTGVRLNGAGATFPAALYQAWFARWSQATERVIGQGIFAKRKKTLLFNGYVDEVSHLYKGMDLKKYY